MGVTLERIIELHPRLYHMAERGSWPSIKKHGLLSTSAMLDLWGITGDKRKRIEELRRPTSELIDGNGLGNAIIRDQHPLSDKKLAGCLTGGMTTRDWYRLLNRQVFFWLTEDRLRILMAAYSRNPNLVLEVSTEGLLRKHWDKVKLSPMNSGATNPMAFPRGPETFQPPAEYDFESNAKKKGGARRSIVELTVDYAVPDVAEFILTARHARVAGDKIQTTERVFNRRWPTIT